MLKDKKGFTLVEIIVCISLLTLIAVVVIVFNVNKDEDKEKEKIKSDIVDAANVYGSMNNEIIEKARANYGYYVLTIDELKEMGILDINQVIPTESAEELSRRNNPDYSKILINIKDEMGFVDYIYPYFDNIPELLNLEAISIEFEEIDDFYCNSLLTGEAKNDGKVVYLNKDYKKIVTPESEYSCKILKNDNSTNELKTSGVSNLVDGENKLLYKLNSNSDIEGIRTVKVLPNFVAEPVAWQADPYQSELPVYDCGSGVWTKFDVILSLKNIDERNIIVKMDENISKNYEENKKYIVEQTGNYEISYTYNRLLSGEKSGSEYCQVNIDKKSPFISFDYNTRKLTINDDDSGVKGYCKSTEENWDGKTSSCDEWVEVEEAGLKSEIVTIDKNKYTIYIYAVDNAGNVEKKIIETDTIYPSILVDSVEGRVSKFKVTVSNENSSSDYDLDLDSIRIQYELDRDKYSYYNSIDDVDFNVASQYDLNYFRTNFSYNSSLEQNVLSGLELSKSYINYIDYKNRYVNIHDYNNDNDRTISRLVEDGECNSKECSFIIDMEEFMNLCLNNDHCNKIVNISDLNNLSLNYYIYVKNKVGNFKRLKFNSKLKIFIDSNAYVLGNHNVLANDKIGGDRGWSNLRGINDNQDLVFTYCKNLTCSIYYHNNNSNATLEIGSYTKDSWHDSYTGLGEKTAIFTDFTNNQIKYIKCHSNKGGYSNDYFARYTNYTYNINTNRTTSGGEITTYNTAYCDNVASNSMQLNYPNITVTNNFLSTFLEEYNTKWYKKRTGSSGTSYYLDDMLNNSVFSRNINGDTYNYVLIKSIDKYSNTFRHNLYYRPKVILNTIETEVGK